MCVLKVVRIFRPFWACKEGNYKCPKKILWVKKKKKQDKIWERLSCVAKKESELIRVEHGHSVTLVLTEVSPIRTISLPAIWFSLYTFIVLFILFTEPKVGKVWAGKLEESSRSRRNCRHIYSLMAGDMAKGERLRWGLYTIHVQNKVACGQAHTM